MTKVELTQNELKTLVAIINHAFNKGGLNVIDASVLVPLFGKLDLLIEKPKEENKLTEPN